MGGLYDITTRKERGAARYSPPIGPRLHCQMRRGVLAQFAGRARGRAPQYPPSSLVSRRVRKSR